MKLACLLLVAGCSDALDQRLDVVDAPRVLAITSEPPEITPGNDVMLSALIASPDGTLATVPAWSLCTAPKPPTEDNAVADGCVGDQVVAIASTATIPVDACRTYGPDVATTGFRPRDPDATGGYYQPIRAAVPALDLAFGFTRITCDLANAPGDVAHQYQLEYVANANPVMNAPDVSASVTANTDVTLSISWPASSVESYVYFDPESEALVTRREAMRVSWFTTGGTIEVDASAVDETQTATSVSTTWHTPAVGVAHLWFVLRDSRGGIATSALDVLVH